MPVRVQDTCGRRTTDWRHEKRKSAQERNFFAKNLVQYRKRHYLCTANEAGQGHSPAGLERCSHIAEVIGSNPIVPTSQHERGGRTFMERPPLLCMRAAPHALGGFHRLTHKFQATVARALPHVREATPPPSSRPTRHTRPGATAHTSWQHSHTRPGNTTHTSWQHRPRDQATQPTRPAPMAKTGFPTSRHTGMGYSSSLG